MPKRTLAPMLKTATSIGAISRSMCATSASTSSLLARVGREAVRLAAVGPDLRDQRRELVGAAPRDAGDEAFAREAACDRAAGGVAGTDDEHRVAYRLHIVPSGVDALSQKARHLRIRVFAPFDDRSRFHQLSHQRRRRQGDRALPGPRRRVRPGPDLPRQGRPAGRQPLARRDHPRAPPRADPARPGDAELPRRARQRRPSLDRARGRSDPRRARRRDRGQRPRHPADVRRRQRDARGRRAAGAVRSARRAHLATPARLRLARGRGAPRR